MSRVLLWPPDRISHAADTSRLKQRWLALRPLTLLCQCPCDPCSKVVNHPGTSPFQGFCTCVVKGEKFQLCSRTVIGNCPNGKEPQTFGIVNAMGFFQSIILIVVLELKDSWQSYGWDLRNADRPVFLNPTRVEPFQMVFLTYGNKHEECLDAMAELLKERKLSGWQRESVKFNIVDNLDLLQSLPGCLSRSRKMKHWLRTYNFDEAVSVSSEESFFESPSRHGTKNPRSPNFPTIGGGLRAKKQKNSSVTGSNTEDEEEEQDDEMDRSSSDTSLPEGWRRTMDDNNKEYFYNKHSLQTQWDRPF